jgi:hypothetical protein
VRETKAEKKLRQEIAVSVSKPDVQDDILAIDDQQEKGIWIDPGMREHPVVNLDGLGDDEEEDLNILIMRMISETSTIKKFPPLSIDEG